VKKKSGQMRSATGERKKITNRLEMNQSNLKYVNFQSTNNINKFSNHKEMFTNSFNLNPNIKESIALI
jgi:hypothetical protein